MQRSGATETGRRVHPSHQRGEAREGKEVIGSRWILLVLAVVTAALLGLGLTSDPKTADAIEVRSTTSTSAATHCPSARRALTFYRLKWAQWRALRGAPARYGASNYAQPNGCAHVKWATDRWADKARSSRLSYKEWQKARWIVREQRTWLKAITHVQKVYPGTYDWLYSCSASEGAHGAWVPNRQGSGASGWLQFMSGTFYSFIERAAADARARGWIIPREAFDWYSPIGQALAGGWAITHGMRHHWSGSGC